MMNRPAKKFSAKKKTVTAQQTAINEAERKLKQLMAGGELITRSDLDALLASLHGPPGEDGLSDAEANARAEAQELAFDALEAESEAQARKLANRARWSDLRTAIGGPWLIPRYRTLSKPKMQCG